MADTTTGRLDRGDGVHLAWAMTAATHADGRRPTTVFLPGFRSDMTGSKAQAMQACCRARGDACLLLDYSGHGASDGAFTDGTIGDWTSDALLLIDQLTQGPLLLVGSSMGGWIALLAALARPARMAGLIGIAAAPDFTEALMWESMMPPERAALIRHGVLMIPSQYGEPTPVTLRLIQHQVMRGPIAIECPVRLLHGQQDPDVPWETSLRLAERLNSANVLVTLIKDGDHRLSRPEDLAVLEGLHGACCNQNDPR
jgi:pimeloyl-ACP methyl ester carboxylesterase